MLASTALLAGYTINMLLHMSHIMGVKSYESLAQMSFGKWGKLITTFVIILHCIGGSFVTSRACSTAH